MSDSVCNTPYAFTTDKAINNSTIKIIVNISNTINFPFLSIPFQTRIPKNEVIHTPPIIKPKK